jgi:hypothetical protein
MEITDDKFKRDLPFVFINGVTSALKLIFHLQKWRYKQSQMICPEN